MFLKAQIFLALSLVKTVIVSNVSKDISFLWFSCCNKVEAAFYHIKYGSGRMQTRFDIHHGVSKRGMLAYGCMVVLVTEAAERKFSEHVLRRPVKSLHI